MQKGSVVVFESTVYPGCTENDCRQVLEQASGYKHLTDFFLGYSPERVNPGDKEHTIDKIVKVVAGSTPEVCALLQNVYGSVISAGTHPAVTIATAEAAKVIENTQRDLNIALINELAMIFEKVGLDTNEVLEAAGTKWNFLKFKPGLVGGHCIGVDPYYLTHMAEGVGIHPQVILAGRRINDNMGKFVADKIVRMILTTGNGEKHTGTINVAILGVTFKENVPDLRNTKVIDVIESLEAFGISVYAIDPVADSHEYEEEYGRKLSQWEDIPQCDAIVAAVKHDVFMEEYRLADLVKKMNPKRKILADLKGGYDREEAERIGVSLWRL
jgi:UDP-N-acetyl-D-galactosamine dehydrogenase